jgi:glycosidase
MGLRRALSSALLIVSGGGALALAQPPPPRSGPPAWAADAVWYSVVVDRFRNGDPRNDPKASDLRGAAPGDPGRDWQLAPWTSSWYTMLPWERASGRDFYEAILTRRYGGDLQGILEKLEHLSSLGVNGLLLSPVFEAPSALKRDPTFLHHVDNNFGPDPDGDRLVWATESPADPGTWKWSAADRLFLRLVQECHRRQMRVVAELPVAGVGQTFWAFRDLRARGAASKHAGWFDVTRFDDPRTLLDELEYTGLGGAREMPAWKKHGDGLAAGPREHLNTVLRRWSDPNADGDASDGVDGFLLAGGERLGMGFLRELRALVVSLNPEALVAGSLGFEDEAMTRPVDPSPWLAREAIDVAANHALGAAARAFLLDRRAALPVPELDALASRIRALTAPATTLALPLPLDGPDGERAASRAVNPDREPGAPASPKDNPRYDVRAPRAEEGKRVRLLAAFLFASPGTPLLSYGTEVGMWGAADPDALKPMLWPELRFEDEAGHPQAQARKADPLRFDGDLLRYFQALGKARAGQPALRRGGFEALVAEDSRRLYAFARVLDTERVVAAFNLEGRDQGLELPFPVEQVRELLSGRRLRARDGKVTVTLPPLSAAILAPEASRAPPPQ